jgi:hypothetical protein
MSLCILTAPVAKPEITIEFICFYYIYELGVVSIHRYGLKPEIACL